MDVILDVIILYAIQGYNITHNALLFMLSTLEQNLMTLGGS